MYKSRQIAVHVASCCYTNVQVIKGCHSTMQSEVHLKEMQQVQAPAKVSEAMRVDWEWLTKLSRFSDELQMQGNLLITPHDSRWALTLHARSCRTSSAITCEAWIWGMPHPYRLAVWQWIPLTETQDECTISITWTEKGTSFAFWKGNTFHAISIYVWPIPTYSDLFWPMILTILFSFDYLILFALFAQLIYDKQTVWSLMG